MDFPSLMALPIDQRTSYLVAVGPELAEEGLWPRGVLEEALQLLSDYRRAPKFGRDRDELQPTLDIEDRIDAFLAAQGHPGPMPAQEQGGADHG